MRERFVDAFRTQHAKLLHARCAITAGMLVCCTHINACKYQLRLNQPCLNSRYVMKRTPECYPPHTVDV